MKALYQLLCLSDSPQLPSSPLRKNKADWNCYEPVKLPDQDFIDALSYVEGGSDYILDLLRLIEERYVYAVKFMRNQNVIGYAVFKSDNFGKEKYLVLMHVVSKYRDFLVSIEDFVYALGRGIGATKTRHHVNDPALVRILTRRFGCEIMETVLTKDIPNEKTN